MEHTVKPTSPLPSAEAERRLRENLRQTYRRGALVADVAHYAVTLLVLTALTAAILSTHQGPAIAVGDKSQRNHMIQIVEQNLKAI